MRSVEQSACYDSPNLERCFSVSLYSNAATQDTSMVYTCMEHETRAMCCQWEMVTLLLPSCCGPAQVVDLLADHCFQASQSLQWFGFGAIQCLFGRQGNAMGSSRDHARESLLQQMPIPDTMKVLAQPMSSMRS